MPLTEKDDRLDTISLRTYGNIDSESLRTLIWANRDTMGVPQTFDAGLDYTAPTELVSVVFASDDRSQLMGGVIPLNSDGRVTPP